MGTGYAARLRAEALQSDSRATLVAVAGHTLEKTQEFSQTHELEAVPSWMELVQRSDLDLIIVANVNRDHAAIVRAALEAGKHVIVEYPLALEVGEAAALIDLARSQYQLLHVEHIELLGGMHQALKAALPQVGTVFYARYATINPQRPAPPKWTYHPDLFGFPLMGALSRLHRLTDLFGTVKTVNCQARFWDAAASGQPGPHYAACLCQAQLQFESGLLADVCYGKGETLWQAERQFQVHGESGALIMNGDEGTLVLPDRSEPIAVGTRRGLFGKDTAIVLDHLTTGAPLYVQPEASLYTLKVADAARRSAQSGQTIAV